MSKAAKSFWEMTSEGESSAYFEAMINPLGARAAACPRGNMACENALWPEIPMARQ
jgi:hypothetical protein